MTKPRDIPALIAFLDSRLSTPHAIGHHANDCIAFMLGAVEAQSGVQVAPHHRWTTLRGARRLAHQLGGLEAVLDAHFERIAPAQAMRGDIAGVPDAIFGIHPMIVEGMLLVGPGEQGTRRLPRQAMTCAWSALGHKPPGAAVSKAAPHV